MIQRKLGGVGLFPSAPPHPRPDSHSLLRLRSRSPGWRRRTCEVTRTESLLLSVAITYPLSLSQPYLVQDSGGSFFTRPCSTTAGCICLYLAGASRSARSRRVVTAGGGDQPGLPTGRHAHGRHVFQMPREG